MRNLRLLLVSFTFMLYVSSHAKRISNVHFLNLDEDIHDLKIITGLGRGSKEYMKPVLKPEISHVLETQFKPSLKSYIPRTNQGCLVVPKENIKLWLEGNRDC